MKHWSELNRLETQIIRLEELRSLFSVLASGAEESSAEDVRSALWYVEGSMNSIHNELRNDFDNLWQSISENETEELIEQVSKKHKGGMKKKKQMTDRELP
jgi:predicted transcriptional regulator